VAVERWEANDVNIILSMLSNDIQVPCVRISARPVLRYKGLFCRFRIYDEMKKPLGENLALYLPRGMAHVD
jgi:hypothetical protein